MKKEKAITINNIEFMGLWEQMHNPDFKGNEFVTFQNWRTDNA
jgi:hypothetical protein